MPSPQPSNLQPATDWWKPTVAYGMNLSNESYNDGFDTVSALQNVTLDDSSVTATATGAYAVGILAENHSYGYIFNTSFATQLLTVENGSSVTASGVYALGIGAENSADGWDGISAQIIALANASVDVTATGNSKYNGAGIAAYNLNETYSGVVSQAVTVAASSITTTGDNMTGVISSNVDDSAYGLTTNFSKNRYSRYFELTCHKGIQDKSRIYGIVFWFFLFFSPFLSP